MYLFFHIFSHVIFGVSIIWCCLPRQTWKEIITTLSFGALCGILPDLFGGRATNPWSHSILVLPFLCLGVAFIAKRIYKEVSFKRLWGACFLAVLIGHLFLDYLGHEISLLYPFDHASLRIGAITLGDPIIWVPLLIGVIVSLCMKLKPRLPAFIAILFVILYLVFRIIAMEVIYHKVETQYPVSEKSYIIIEPNTHYEYSFFSKDWIEYRFKIISSHHLRGGYAGILGEKLGTMEWHNFFPMGRDLQFRDGMEVPMVKANLFSLFVLEEWTEDGYSFVKGQANNKIYVYKEVRKNQWEEQVK
ncbi:metal-dependent hydrolase [Paenibacillus sp. CGMCC 1.18879]|uniref:metal-dependent hydrolase n=3 Tax=Paenibacillus TaxID=44249 RepID=UPI00223AA90B|nr:metal-dependent hydrolase [Paenibacillus sp. CGMCC 1.18879]